MSDLDMLLPQTSAEAQASPPRRPSVQVAPKPKLRDFPEIIGE